MELSAYGWDSEWEALFAPWKDQGLLAGRVIKQGRDLSTVVTAAGEAEAEVSGKFRRAASGPADFPAVGDWAALRTATGGRAVIEALLPRRSAFTRKAAGEAVEAQVVAANVDTVFLVSGLDGDFNLRRIERYVATAWSSGARPVLVLNKADLRPDLDEVAVLAAAAAPAVPIVTANARAAEGLEALGPYLESRKTVALLGSSGVGKSTIINRLLGEERFATAAVSDAGEGRGRHTTTARELVRLPGGALLVDTPGMRELGLWADDDGIDRTFDEIERLAAGCRFPDCAHEREPGCAVRAAVEDGSLDPARLESYLKLRRELRFLELKKDEKTRRQHEKAVGRDFAARIKEVKKTKLRYR
ncbi:MAG TPA: ribosome small subunit-dependent GTPase A [Candidatus Aminicenantes bacterium]|nr:ribosome small subunit-dependent GTPase A [Candidatus Aminicenantes bacterium]HRY65884.1 ribosome small subunit-dependent GTPase A [Candidatus Aminicenantes bacterium]HRZ72790.1 ribosome small subunit-dependent GTPase A [Candidatus Aminicenantes bacterium]